MNRQGVVGWLCKTVLESHRNRNGTFALRTYILHLHGTLHFPALNANSRLCSRYFVFRQALQRLAINKFLFNLRKGVRWRRLIDFWKNPKCRSSRTSRSKLTDKPRDLWGNFGLHWHEAMRICQGSIISNLQLLLGMPVVTYTAFGKQQYKKLPDD